MAGITDEPEFLIFRAKSLLEATLNGKQDWRKISSGKAKTSYNVVVPEDGEDYFEPVSLMRVGTPEKPRYVLATHGTGIPALIARERNIFGRTYRISSTEYPLLKELGDLVFSKANDRRE